MTCYLQDYQRKVFPMPIWKAFPLQKEEGFYGSILQALPALAGEGPKIDQCLGTVGCSAFLNSRAGLISPAGSTQPPRVTNFTAHIQRGRSARFFKTWQTLCCSDTSTHPLLPISILFCQHWSVLSSRSLFKVVFPKRRKPASTECADVQRHMKSQYFHNKEGSFSIIVFPGRVMDQATKDLWWWSSFSTMSRRHMLHIPAAASLPNSFCLWLCSRRNTFHFLRNKCYDSHMDWIKSTKARPLSQTPNFMKKN